MIKFRGIPSCPRYPTSCPGVEQLPIKNNCNFFFLAILRYLIFGTPVTVDRNSLDMSDRNFSPFALW